MLKEGQYLMEIKVAESMPMPIAKKLSELGIFPTSFSKYGTAYTDMISGQTKTHRTEPTAEYEREVAYA